MAASWQEDSQGLCIGDHICLYSVSSAGYVFSDQTSSAQNRLYIHHNQNRLDPTNIPNPEVVTFEVCIQKRYKLNRKLHLLNTSYASASNEEIRQIQDAAVAESKDNQLEETRLLGKPVKYGDIIQLRHVFSGKSILVDTSKTSSYDKNKLVAHLKNYNAKNAQFRVLPMYKVNSMGEPVMLGDQVCLESVKTPGQYLHASKPFEFQGLDKCCELNVGVDASAFTLYCRVHRTPNSVTCKALQGGSVIQLNHRHMEAYLTAEGMFGTEPMVTESVHFKIRESDLRVPSTLYPPTSSATFWQVEAADSIIDGSPLYWGHYIRLRHYNTRMYLCIDNDKSVTLTKQSKDPRTVFQLHQMSFQKSGVACVESGSSCRIQHAVTGFWLCGLKDKKYTRKTSKWLKEELKMVGCSEEMQYQDAFCLQLVARNLVKDCNIISGMAGLIQYLHSKITLYKTVDASHTDALLIIIMELIHFISKPIGVHACKTGDRREVVREIKILQLLQGFLDQAGDWEAKATLRPVYNAYFKLLRLFIANGSREDCLYLAQFLDNFLAYLASNDSMTLNVSGILVELIKDREEVLERLTRRQRDSFIGLVKKFQHPSCLQLLGTLCVCSDVAVPENQTNICDKLSKNKKKGLYKLSIIQKVVHITKDSQSEPIKLSQFLKHASNEEIQFFTEQLHLFQKLVHGRNQHCIDLMITTTESFTSDIAMAVLKSQGVPDDIRALFCDLLIVFFIDVGENTSILDNLSDTFVYRKVESRSISTADWITKQKCQMDTTLKSFLPSLKQWLENFLKSNPYMIANQVERNKLVFSVFRLMRALLVFGCCSSQDIITWIGYVLNLIRGTQDLPFQAELNNTTMQCCNIVFGLKRQNTLLKRVTRYRMASRFEKGSQTDIIVGAKYEALLTLEVLFDLVSHFQVEKFVAIFKEVDGQTKDSKSPKALLRRFLVQDFVKGQMGWFQRDPIRVMQREIERITRETTLLEDKILLETMLDMAAYDYTHMTTKSLELLIKHCFAHETLIDNAQQTQLLMTKASLAIQKDVLAVMPLLRRLVAVNFHKDQLQIVITILDKFKEFSVTESNASSNMLSQNILVNHGVIPLLITLLEREYATEYQTEHAVKLESSVLNLMSAMSHGNPCVQRLLFQQLHVIMRAQRSPKDLARTLIQIFQGNRELCCQIDHHQVVTVVKLLVDTGHKVAALLDVLSTWVTVCDKGGVIRRNKLLVMKYLLEAYPKCAYVFELPRSERRSILQLRQGRDMLQYFIKLVHFLDVCGKGARGNILSFCQNVLSMTEILQILNTTTITSNLKRHFVKYLHWIFFIPGSQGFREKLSQNSQIWNYFKLVANELDMCAKYVKQNEDKLVPWDDIDECHVPKEDDQTDIVQTTLDYMLDAVLSFINDFIKCCGVSTEVSADKQQTIQNLSIYLTELLPTLTSVIKSHHHYRILKTTIKTMIRFSCSDPLESSRRIVEIERALPCRLRHGLSDTARNLDQAIEVGTNVKFQWFSANVERLLQPANTLRAQLGITNDLADKAYVNIHSMQALPLSAGFQKLVNTFIDGSSKVPHVRFKKATILIRQLSATADKAKDGVETGTDDIDVMCLNVLRALLYNQMVLLPSANEPKTGRGNRWLIRLKATQEWMVSQQLIPTCFQLLNRHNRCLIKAVLALLSSLLFDALPCVQNACLEYFKSTREEIFFLVVKDQFQRSALWFKERKSFFSKKSKELVEAHVPFYLRPDVEDVYESPEDAGVAVAARVGSDDVDMVELLLSALASLCDGQHTELQNYMREQCDNLKSYDLVTETTRCLTHVAGSKDYFKLTKEIFNTLNEFCQGNQENRLVILNNKVVDHINLVLRSALFVSTSIDQALGTYNVVADLLISLLEERSPEALQVAKEVAVTIDSEAVLTLLTTCYNIYKMPWWVTIRKNKVHPLGLNESPSKKELQDAWNIGYKGFIIHRRLQDVHPDSIDHGTVTKDHERDEKTLKHKRALHFFQQNVHSIEVLKGNDLQKIYFPLTEKNKIRGDMRKNIKWNIDRSCTTNKVRELLQWSQVIIAESSFRENPLWSPLVTFLTGREFMFSNMVILLSITINIIMLVTWKSKASIGTIQNTSSLPDEIYDRNPEVMYLDAATARTVDLSLGLAHNICAFFVLLCYFLSNRPKLPSLKAIGLAIRNLCGKLICKDKERNNHDGLIHGGFLLSFSTVYYLVFFGLSITGTLFNGYSFAFHLLHIVNTNELLKGVIQAVSLNVKSLVWVTILGLFILYLYAVIGFMFFRPSFDPSEQMYCDHLYECVISIVRYGMVGDIDDKLALHEQETGQFNRFGWLVLYQVSFFIIFTTIGLNIIFGIIVDTFSELRNRKWEAEKDMKEVCFICGQPSYKFEQRGKGFYHHVQKEHNMWDYLYYLKHLADTHPTSYTTLDLHVSTLVQQNRHDFFPINRALCLDESVEDQDDAHLTAISANVHYLVDKHKQEERLSAQRKGRQQHETWRQTQLLVDGTMSSEQPVDGSSIAVEGTVTTDSHV